ELAELLEKAQAGLVEPVQTSEARMQAPAPPAGTADPPPVAQTGTGEAPALAAKASYREFYDDVTRRLAPTGVAEASVFLNYGYVGNGNGDEAVVDVADNVFNPNSIRLAFELVGATELRDRRVLDIGCGRGGTVAVLAEVFGASAVGVDLSPEAVTFCRRVHH